MAALGLTSYGQLALASTTYSGLTAISWTPGAPQQIVHLVPSSTVHPVKNLGRGTATLAGTLQMTATNWRSFAADCLTQTSRKASFLDDDGTEVYVYVTAATISGPQMVKGRYGAPSSSNLVRVDFSFVCGDQRLYKSSDDSVLLGG